MILFYIILIPDSRDNLGEFPVVVKDGMARTETGSNTLQLINGVKNLMGWSDDPLYKVWHRASLSPAESLGKADKLGSIETNKLADYVVLDSNLDVTATAS